MTRQEFLDEIYAHLAHGRHVLITGERGIGKSHILGRIARERPTIYISNMGAKKQTLLNVLQCLFEDGRLEDFAYFVDWQDVLKKLRRKTIAQLLNIVSAALSSSPRPALSADVPSAVEGTEGGHYLVALDDLDTVSERGLLDVILPLMNVAQFLAAANTSTGTRKRRVGLVVDKFKTLDVPPMTTPEARALLWATLNRDQYPHWQVIETKVLNHAAGMPGVVVDLAQALAGTTGSLAEIRDLEHTSGVPRVNIAFPLAMAIIAAVFAGRYLARGLDDPTLYVLAGIGSALTYMLRPYIWKMKS
jgi:energy-coupling factor transporter ATP-binding protein EcfA2